MEQIHEKNTPSLSKKVIQMLERPLIIGASVSGDHLTDSPGKVLAKRYTDSVLIKTIARGGRPGKEVLKLMSDRDLADRSIVIGFDLFFWDATLTTAHQSLMALHKLVEQTAALKIPLVLGEVPELLPSRQPHAEKLSREMERLADQHSHVMIVPIVKILESILGQGFLAYRGKRYSLFELVPDGLHIGKIAAEYLADELGQELEAWVRAKK